MGLENSVNPFSCVMHVVDCSFFELKTCVVPPSYETKVKVWNSLNLGKYLSMLR